MIADDVTKAGPRPLLGITMGDACGIGVEVIVKALSHLEVYRLCRPLVIGHPAILDANLKFAGRSLEVRAAASPEAGAYRWGTIDIWSPVDVDLAQIETGTVCPEAGRAAVEWVVAAVDLAMAGEIDTTVLVERQVEHHTFSVAHLIPRHSHLRLLRNLQSGAELIRRNALRDILRTPHRR